SPLQRVECVDRFGHLAGTKGVDRMEEKAIRTSRIVLKHGRRVAASAKRMPGHNCADRFRARNQAVCHTPGMRPALIAEAQCTAEIGIGSYKVTGSACASLRVGDDASEDG